MKKTARFIRLIIFGILRQLLLAFAYIFYLLFLSSRVPFIGRFISFIGRFISYPLTIVFMVLVTAVVCVISLASNREIQEPVSITGWFAVLGAMIGIVLWFAAHPDQPWKHGGCRPNDVNDRRCTKPLCPYNTKVVTLYS